MLMLALALAASSTGNCESLRTMSTPQTIVMSADVVPAGVFTPPPQPAPAANAAPAGQAAAGARGRGARAGGAPPPPPEPIPQHCRVKLTLKPTSDSNIYSELWLPTDNWNGKLLVVGNGGFAGSIQGYGDMQIALRLGYATAATDTGHNATEGPNGMFALGHPEKIVDFAYRALHDTTVESSEHFRVMIAHSTGQGAAQAIDISDINITDNDTVTPTTYNLTPDTTTVNENAGNLTFTVTRSGSFPAETLYASTLYVPTVASRSLHTAERP